MSFELWPALVAASAVLLAIPGPTVVLVLSDALSRGHKATPATAGGGALIGMGLLTATPRRT